MLSYQNNFKKLKNTMYNYSNWMNNESEHVIVALKLKIPIKLKIMKQLETGIKKKNKEQKIGLKRKESDKQRKTGHRFQ